MINANLLSQLEHEYEFALQTVLTSEWTDATSSDAVLVDLTGGPIGVLCFHPILSLKMSRMFGSILA